MQSSTPAGSSSSSGCGSGGGGDFTRGSALPRFRSAPATWLEALLEDEDEDPLKPNQCLTELLTADTAPVLPTTTRSSGSSSVTVPDQGLFGFNRQNSSPADFLSGVGSDGYFSSFPIPANYDYLPPANVDASPLSKRVREMEGQDSLSQLKGEQSGQSPLGVSDLADMNMEKLLEDAVPCRVRAKRGFATHPRSIAERVRRTRISDRIRKLQELVPNMDKQTNTADMLEEAVEYVKSLQRQIQELTECQKKCTCKAKEIT